MARPREFDREEALDVALELFWLRGYRGASLDDLVGAMGIGKSSLYDTFGSKHALFLAALGRYGDTVSARLIAGLEGPGAARQRIATAFAEVVERAATRGDRRGSFIGNCAVELAPHDGEAAARVREGLSRREAAFHRAVVQGQAAGEIPIQKDALAVARYLNASIEGLHVIAKANPDRTALRDIVGVVLSALD